MPIVLGKKVFLLILILIINLRNSCFFFLHSMLDKFICLLNNVIDAFLVQFLFFVFLSDLFSFLFCFIVSNDVNYF